MMSEKQMAEEAAYHSEQRKVFGLFIVQFFSRSVEVFLRKDFGERYFNLLGASGSAVTMIVVLVLARWQFEGNRVTFGSMVLGVYLLAYVCVAVWRIRQAKKRTEPIHSRYSGNPLVYEWLQAKGVNFIQEHQVKQYIEPILVFLCSMVAGIFSSQLGLWLFFSSLCLFVRIQYAVRAAREKHLDRIDEQLEAEEMAAAIRGVKQPAQSRGVEVWGAFTPEQQELLLKRE